MTTVPRISNSASAHTAKAQATSTAPLAPASTSGFLPRVPFVVAEQHVDYDRILNHIDQRRARVERTAAPAARRLAWNIVHQQTPPHASINELTAKLEKTLDQTARFGYRESERELRRLRRAHPRVVRAAYQFPDAGHHGRLAKQGLPAILKFLRQRSRTTAQATYEAAERAARAVPAGTSQALTVAAAVNAATRALHNHVLELVGETLNLGRTAGILAAGDPPRYAMRSEQLDANTCDPCSELHGQIVEIGSPEYYDLMPPQGCLGGGRCRGIYVYGDEPVQLEQAA